MEKDIIIKLFCEKDMNLFEQSIENFVNSLYNNYSIEIQYNPQFYSNNGTMIKEYKWFTALLIARRK